MIDRAHGRSGPHAGAPRAAAVLHRHRGAARRGAERGHRSTTSTATTSTISSRWSTPTCASARARPSAPRRSSSARSASSWPAPGRRRGDSHHRVAARAAGGDPPAREMRSDADAGCPTPRRSSASAIEALSTAIVNKILHAPITKLRESLARAAPGRSLDWSWSTSCSGLGRTRVIRLGTRASALALVQAREVADRPACRAARRSRSSRCAPRATGAPGAPLAVRRRQGTVRAGDRGRAARKRRSTSAVHSLKRSAGRAARRAHARRLSAARRCARRPRGARTGTRAHDLPPGAVVGTSSPRRRALLCRRGPISTSSRLRGNVDTRLRKLERRRVRRLIVLAAAGPAASRADAGPRECPRSRGRSSPPSGRGSSALEARVRRSRPRAVTRPRSTTRHARLRAGRSARACGRLGALVQHADRVLTPPYWRGDALRADGARGQQ